MFPRFVIAIKGTGRYVISFEPFRTTPNVGGCETAHGITKRAAVYYSKDAALEAIADYLEIESTSKRKFDAFLLSDCVNK